MINWENISYLKYGNKVQKQAYTSLLALEIFEQLSNYNPILTGTIPIGINIINSDLDIICEITDINEFSQKLNSLYSSKIGYILKKNTVRVVCSFLYNGFTIEIYAEQKPTVFQNAYLHMITEYKILNLAGSRFKQAIIQLKQNGLKTEPAFGYLLGMENAYSELLTFSKKTNEEIMHLINKSDWQIRSNLQNSCV